MRTIFGLAMYLVVFMGCARVTVVAPKEPIKMDISMRLDIYQHVSKDIDDIENMVSGGKSSPGSGDKHSMLGYFLSNAYAQDGLSPEVESAALRRKDRRSELVSWEQKGVAGEDRSGLVVVRAANDSGEELKKLVEAENSDRMLIYREISKKNSTSVEEVQKLYAKRLQNDSPAGTPIEALSLDGVSYEWIIKK